MTSAVLDMNGHSKVFGRDRRERERALCKTL